MSNSPLNDSQARDPYEERVFLSLPKITISSSRIDIYGKTYATRNVGSVQVKGSNGLGFFFWLCALAAGIFVASSNLVGALITGAAAAYFGYKASKSRTIILMAGGGEVDALHTYDPEFAEELRTAIAKAISVR